jgi:hypothetical protein
MKFRYGTSAGEEPTMNPFLSKELAGEHIRDLREAARPRRDKAAPEVGERASIRPFADRDIDAIRRLAALDSKPVPVGGVLVAEQAGELVAALPLDGGEVLADPFRPTAEVVALLERKASELRTDAAVRFVRRRRLHLPRRSFAA